jgi:hypothetical protein
MPELGHPITFQNFRACPRKIIGIVRTIEALMDSLAKPVRAVIVALGNLIRRKGRIFGRLRRRRYRILQVTLDLRERVAAILIGVPIIDLLLPALGASLALFVLPRG